MLKWLTTSNYVSDWWEKYVYLRGRSSIMVNSNYYVLDAFTYMPCTNQLARAALFISNILKFKRDLDREEIEPITIRDTVPLCMAQYERLFTTTRIPGKECDTLEHHDYSSYIVVLRKGRYYQLSVYNRKGQILAPFEFENHLHWIVEDADRGDSASYEEEHLAAFTAEERHVWAAVRSEHFASGVNKESLDIIDKAIFVLSLDTETPKDLSSRGKALLHGNGYNRWFDKSFTLVLFPDGRAGLNCEHSWADAPVVAHMWEWVMCHETEDAYDEHGHNIRPESTTPRVATAAPHKLAWDFSPKLSEAIKTAVAKATTIINDLDLSILHHSKYGKDYMKHAKISPDAYVQMALQLAYYHDSNGETPLTYESSMTRLYKQGRTETVRPASVDAREFVRAMVNPSVTKEQRIQLLRKAGETHQNLYRDAMSGKGIDRHLFALYVVSQGLGVDSPFLKDALSRAWKLSTSQQPQQQTKLWEPEGKDRHKIGPGGGFGPVADDGYGTSYMFAGSHCLFAHVSSKISAKNTDSARFANNLERAFEELAALFR
ncbi:carnitine O-acyltransferase [Capsaspora owczarzaki ATCC 30864]|uniref:carnitine O-palmitoyltransferase n=2 Tax=Capsaspora owczarzaki (strain ATCC 30864) TaxID=595528 RepID=A0A0D2VWN5_CAPO3|nr:carnitine O-acyltransferase [Capsaspora owczarzaki ATCC 30864]